MRNFVMKPTFARRFIAGVLGLVSVVAFTSSAQAAGEVKHPRAVNGSWEGPFGRFDRAQLQRGTKTPSSKPLLRPTP